MIPRESIRNNSNSDNDYSNETNFVDNTDQSENDSDEDLEAGEKWLVFFSFCQRIKSLVNQFNLET